MGDDRPARRRPRPVSAEHVEARAAYADSVTLMQLSAQVRQAAGVQHVLVAMGTELNLGLLAELGLPAPDGAGPNELIIAVRASDDAALADALAAVEAGLAARPAAATARTARPAARQAGLPLRRAQCAPRPGPPGPGSR